MILIKDDTKTADQKRIGVAQKIEKKRFGSKRNKIVDAFIEVLEEDPDIVIEYITETGVEWNFKPDSEPVRAIAGQITSLEQMDKKERKEYDIMYKEYELEAVKKAKDKLGTFGVLKTLMGK